MTRKIEPPSEALGTAPRQREVQGASACPARSGRRQSRLSKPTLWLDLLDLRVKAERRHGRDLAKRVASTPVPRIEEELRRATQYRSDLA